MSAVSARIRFDGRQFANNLAVDLESKFKNVKAKIVTILDTENEGSVKYTQLKQNMADRLGVQFEKIEDQNFDIDVLNNDPTVNGIIIQLPYPNSNKLISLIDPAKDVDGLREKSPYLPAVVVAVQKILDVYDGVGMIAVVGSKGHVGQNLVAKLDAVGMDKKDFNEEILRGADVIISATGSPGLIKEGMVKPGFTAIDLGFPKPDFTDEAIAHSSFYTPVPGGVGPVTVVSLFENLLVSMDGFSK
jgi:methylenetetrahydrofolate dehydrogenase (NADP+) / methenyltetrahydrofolate cyclohydrolase